MNLADIIDAPAAACPDRAAMIVSDGPVTYAALRRATAGWAGELARAGVGSGQRVALVDWAGVRAVSATLALACLGAAAVPMNPLLTPPELARLIEIAGCGPCGVAGGSAAPRLGAALGPEGRVLNDVPSHNTALSNEAAATAQDEAVVLLTSGTTGLPKAVPVTHHAIAARIREYRPPFDPAREPAVSLMAVPLFHVGGLLGLLLNLASGDTTVVLERFDAGRWLELAQRYHASAAFMVPTMLARIIDHPAFPRTDLSSLTSIAYGAAAAPVELVQRAMQALPHVGFANVFGQTETLGAYTTLGPADHRDPRRVGSVGRPLPGVSVRIVAPDGSDVSPGEIGELWVDAPSNVRPGWLRTGDLARQDADGYLYPAGRLDDTINRGGEKFPPAEIIEALRTHPAIADVAVAGIVDPTLGERVGVAVVLRPGAAEVTLDELREWCRTRLASYKLPEVLVTVDTLPYNDLGKLTRAATARLIVEHR